MPIRTVIFDLDDTLSDHSFSSRGGLQALQGRYPALAARPLEQLEAHYLELLNRYHLAILAGRETEDTARPARYRDFFAACGQPLAEDQLPAATACYRTGYLAARRAVPGAAALLTAVRARGCRVAVLSNHYAPAEQEQKLTDCGLARLVDRLFVSAALGFSKPHPEAFRAPLAALGASQSETVMVGDSLESDVRGALDAGLRAVWLNRRGLPVPADLGVPVLAALEPTAAAVAAILGAGGI